MVPLYFKLLIEVSSYYCYCCCCYITGKRFKVFYKAKPVWGQITIKIPINAHKNAGCSQ